MNKDIWHITNKNKDTTDIPKKENMVVLDGVLGHSCLWYGGEEPEPIFWENVKRWCYLDDLISSNERTCKALDVAIRGLDQMTWGCDSTDAEHLLKEIEQITALKQIKTALEQKDAK